ncbi:MAG: hypothetical protein ACRYG2_02155 [Janthinobacterium lividum]
MAATTFTSIVMVAFGVLVLTVASYAWFGDWEPQPRGTRSPDDPVGSEVAALRRSIEAYEREHRT